MASKQMVLTLLLGGIIILLGIMLAIYEFNLISKVVTPPKSKYLKLGNGYVEYSINDTMIVEKPYRVTVAIIKNVNDSLFLKATKDKLYKSKEIIVYSDIKLMLKDPEADNFKIEIIGSDEQSIEDGIPTIWNWNIKPIDFGKISLVLTAKNILNDKGVAKSRDFEVFDLKIKVNAEWITIGKIFIINNWQFLMSGIIIPILIIGWRRLKQKPKIIHKPWS